MKKESKEREILDAVRLLRNRISLDRPSGGFILPSRLIYGDIDRTKYKGRGRPRKEDYDRSCTILEQIKRIENEKGKPSR